MQNMYKMQNISIVFLFHIPYTSAYFAYSAYSILCIIYSVTQDAQNRKLLDTLCQKKSNITSHIYLNSTLLIWHTNHLGQMCVSSWPFVPKKGSCPIAKTWCLSSSQESLTALFQLRMDKIWLCKVLLFFSINMKTYTGMKTHKCLCCCAASIVESAGGTKRF